MLGLHAANALRGRGRLILHCTGVLLTLSRSRELSAQRDTARRDTTTLAAATVIGSRSDLSEERAAVLRVPGSVAVLQPTELRATRQANLHDVLQFTPGVYVQPRFGAVQVDNAAGRYYEPADARWFYVGMRLEGMR